MNWQKADSEVRAKILTYLEDYYPDEYREICELIQSEEEEE